MSALPSILREISDARLAAIAGASDSFAEQMNDLSESLRGRTIELLKDLTPENAAAAQTLVELQRAIQGQLNRLGYDGKVKAFVGGYGAFERYALETLKAMSIVPQRLAELDRKALQQLRQMDYSFLADIGPAAAQAVSRGVIQATLVGGSRSDIIDLVSSQIRNKFKNQAATYADTALVSYDRRASSALWVAAGLNNYIYRGPKDIKNRPFCEEHVGKVYSLTEIKRMDNGQKAPLNDVLTFGGGWNCRHVWTPTVQEPEEKPVPPRPIVTPPPPAGFKIGPIIGPVGPRPPALLPGGGITPPGPGISLPGATKPIKPAVLEAKPKLPRKPAAPKTKRTWEMTGPEIRTHIDGLVNGWQQKYADMVKQIEAIEVQIEQLRQRAFSQNPVTGSFTYTGMMGEDAKLRASLERKRDKLRREAKNIRDNQGDRAAVAKALEAEKPGFVNWRIIDPVATKVEDRWRAGIASLARLVGDDTLQPLQNYTVEFRKEPKGRSYHTMGNIWMAMGDDEQTVVHELGHWLELRDPYVHQKALEFLDRRTKGETAQKLSKLFPGTGYDPWEVTRPDAFDPDGKKTNSRAQSHAGAYVGKDYNRNATEIVSMGLEYMRRDPLTFAKADADYFDFMWDLLHRRLP